MKLTKKQCEFIKNSKFGIIATAISNQPRACVAIAEEAENDYVIFADVQMAKTDANIKANEKVFVSFYDSEMVYCLKADGTAEYLKSGEVFEKLKNKLAQQGLKIKAAVKIKLFNIFEGKES